jgi:Uma2 family endonuclease
MATLEWKQVRHLLLVVEVVSPSSRRFDRFTKRVEFQRQGIPLYWVVDAEGEQVEEWTPTSQTPLIRRDRLAWHPAGASVPFELELAWLFRAPL